MAKATMVEKKDPRAIASDKKVTPALQHEFHTINIAEQEGELPYVDIFISGTNKDAKGKEQPFARNFQILRGQNVMNVPKMVVHVLMDTAIETRFRQEVKPTRDGGKRNTFIAFKKHSYPCTIVESYDVKKDVGEDGLEVIDGATADILIET